MLIFKKEKRVVGLILEHVDKTTECVQVTTDGMKDCITDGTASYTETAERVNTLESEADALLRDIRDLLYSGAYLPLIRADLYGLMSATDNVCNKAEDCSDFFQYQHPDIPEEFRAEIVALLDLTAECCQQFRKALRHFFKPKDAQEKVRARSRNVSEVESKIDTVERQLTARVFDSSLDKSSKLHLQLYIASIVDISDMIEDAIDVLELVSLKSIV